MSAATLELKGFEKSFEPNFEEFISVLKRKKTPSRVFNAELFLDSEVSAAADKYFGITDHLDKNDPDYDLKWYIAVQRFLGYDYVNCKLEGSNLTYIRHNTADTEGDQGRDNGREWMEEGTGPISSWEDFEKYNWPDVSTFGTDTLEKMGKILPDDMCIVGRGGHFCENLVWLFGYENLCYKLFDDRKLIEAVVEKVTEIEVATWRLFLENDRVKIMWASDDLGFKTGLMISPDDTREFILPGHKKLAQLARDAGRVSILHACGKKDDIYEDLIEDVKLDAVHSYEDTIEMVTDAKKIMGDRISLLGGIDVDFLCRNNEEAIRKRVRETLDICQPGGGYALGTGNSVTNYIPLENYLVMLDEGKLYGS